MQNPDVMQGAVGAVLVLTVYDQGEVVDLTEATGVEIIIRGAQGPRQARTGTVASPPTAGIVRYTTVAGDLQYAGRTEVQAVVTFSDGSRIPSTKMVFEVGASL